MPGQDHPRTEIDGRCAPRGAGRPAGVRDAPVRVDDHQAVALVRVPPSSSGVEQARPHRERRPQRRGPRRQASRDCSSRARAVDVSASRQVHARCGPAGTGPLSLPKRPEPGRATRIVAIRVGFVAMAAPSASCRGPRKVGGPLGAPAIDRGRAAMPAARAGDRLRLVLVLVDDVLERLDGGRLGGWATVHSGSCIGCRGCVCAQRVRGRNHHSRLPDLRRTGPPMRCGCCSQQHTDGIRGQSRRRGPHRGRRRAAAGRARRADPVRRREVIARIRTAKEHGDLKENSDYHAAREEQSFLEGRVQAIEARLRSAVIVDAPAAGSRVGLGSVVTLDDDGEAVTYTIVGADESDPRRAGSRRRRRSAAPSSATTRATM